MERAADGRDVVLSARGVTVNFGPKIVLDKLDLDIYRGEILGFVGPSGAGKSVLMRTVLRLRRAAPGRSKFSVQTTICSTNRTATSSTCVSACFSSKVRCFHH